MPITKTAKRALRSSKRKADINTAIKTKLQIAIRLAEKTKTTENIKKAVSLADRAVKKNVIHKNKSSRIKKSLSKVVKPVKKTSVKKTKKTTKKK